MHGQSADCGAYKPPWALDPAVVGLFCRLDPLDLGIKRCEVADLAGGDAQLNASILTDVFGGARGAVADALNLNAGVALAAAEIASSPAEGVAMAQVSLPAFTFLTCRGVQRTDQLFGVAIYSLSEDCPSHDTYL